MQLLLDVQGGMALLSLVKLYIKKIHIKKDNINNTLYLKKKQKKKKPILKNENKKMTTSLIIQAWCSLHKNV